MKHKPSFIENIAEKLGIIENLHPASFDALPRMNEPGELSHYPPPEKWDDWTEYEAKSGLKREKKNYMIVPTTCFNCESGCGLLSYVDKESMKVRKFEGNPYHPGSRGRNCAKGPATINQINDVDRILYPMRRKGERGAGGWERVSWDDALDDIAGKIREALKADKKNEVVYHVGRPGHEGFMDRILQSWGVDGHNSHTNICSAGARFGYAIWHGADRPSPDHANAQFILLISAHLESGHYFNPHAQRIMEGLMNGAKMCVMDPRLSNTASMADYWMPTYPGSEAAVLLAIAKILIDEGLYNREFMFNWVNWRESLAELNPQAEVTFENFIEELKKLYAEYTPEFAETESGATAEMIREVAKKVGEAGTRLATHNWRSAGSGNLGGWAVSRCLHFLNVLTGSVGTVGGTMPSAWNKFHPTGFSKPPAQKFWNELHFPKEYPLTHYELSQLLPHFLTEGRGKLQVYFTRVFNPVWTYPDGFMWMDALSDQEKIGMHIALTPTWNETSYFADYVLPMGHSSERHDLISYETHSGKWIGFRQPVLREAARRLGQETEFTYETNPGEVWEEDEFWIELSWRIDPDGSLGIREHFISPYRPGEKITIDEYYRFIFENTRGLSEKAAEEGLDALAYMRKYGAFEVESETYNVHLKELGETVGTTVDEETGTIIKDGKNIGVMIEGRPHQGFGTPSRKQEFFSETLKDWGWPEYKTPTYIKSHIHRENLKDGEIVLVPTFRLPTLVHSRSGNAKWLAEIAHRNPLWIHPEDAEKWGVGTNDLVRVSTDIGYFVNKAWVTEGMKPGVVACSHHLGRWSRAQDPANNRWAMNQVSIEKKDGSYKMRVVEGIRRSKTEDPDTERIFWSDGGVHQNITFPVHPDPISGMHCWHQRVRVEKAHADDKYGDVFVDTEKSMEVYREWLEMTRPAPGPNGLRRPLWLARPLRPVEEMFYIKDGKR
ncbi:MAG: molybdopterin-dependent oxidoreductase [Acidobacteriota bacterium]|nr:molybdopterin-dependent oxidoreductase [Acidobacteriota bacterium]MDH3528908.1 molybdopterin-dependent oxidoreductase [Acidobacteriota bacterium]